MLREVRNPLLEEALRSPALLSDLAGLEQYVAESYDARSFVELLQNADDVEPRGLRFNEQGVCWSLPMTGANSTNRFREPCRSAASSKHRGTSIGFAALASSRSWALPRQFTFSAANLRRPFLVS